VPGKEDWLARGLPTEGERAGDKRVDAYARDDVVTCGLGDTIAAVRPRVADSPYGFALVVADGGVLLGRLRKSALDGDPDARAEDVMEPGPSTVRPDSDPADLRKRLTERDLRTAVVSTPEGALIGVVLRTDL
jgi:CBS domain-containing protein